MLSSILSVKENPTELVHTGRLKVLDGWRALSIILVLCAHLLPLNVFWSTANEAAGVAGMAIFFTLSGFLITRFLLDRPDPRSFLIRRLLRIVPLAWLTMLILYIWNIENTSVSEFLANILFFFELASPASDGWRWPSMEPVC